MRNAKMTTLDEFRNIINKKLINNEGHVDLTEKIYKDLNKVDFSFENFEHGLDQYPSPGSGFRQLKNGLPYLQCYAGGDWEYPVYFIIYWNGKELRGYIPDEGNTYDKKYKCAHGSQNEQESWPEDKDIPEEPENKEDFTVMEQDITDRIKII